MKLSELTVEAICDYDSLQPEHEFAFTIDGKIVFLSQNEAKKLIVYLQQIINEDKMP